MSRFVPVLIPSVLVLLFAVSPLYAEETWKVLFDGTLKDWSVPKYGGDGKVEAKKDVLVIGRGDSMTGVRYGKTLPATDYELSYEARRTLGSDFFAACTFPVGKDFCTLVNGGWGGAITGLSSVNGSDASENETSANYDYEDNVWYRFRILVTKKAIQVWIAKPDKKKIWDEKLVVDIETDDRTFSVRFEMNDYKPLGFCTWSSEGELRNIRYRKK
ncbi:MAG: DUF1080 domain-containing protein [Planctomycetaceae bacterium]|jgi:hypothetical protein|nr:DUF1080 domain-containing protein [Planctomycetaceae bacterium]